MTDRASGPAGSCSALLVALHLYEAGGGAGRTAGPGAWPGVFPLPAGADDRDLARRRAMPRAATTITPVDQPGLLEPPSQPALMSTPHPWRRRPVLPTAPSQVPSRVDALSTARDRFCRAAVHEPHHDPVQPRVTGSVTVSHLARRRAWARREGWHRPLGTCPRARREIP